MSSSTLDPWVVIGDFNTVRFPNERINGAMPRVQDMDEFNSCISSSDLLDLHTIGNPYSWNNRSAAEEKMYTRLDRVLVNASWMQTHSNSFAKYKYPGISDHSPLVLSLAPAESQGPKPFKFMNAWLDDVSLYLIVEKAWAINVQGNPMYRLVQKLKEVRKDISIWKKDVFGRIDIIVPLIRKDIEIVQAQLMSNPGNPDLSREENRLRDELLKWSAREESILRQKSRQNWLKLGDFNSKIFHFAIKIRENTSHILALKGQDDSLISDPAEISESFVSYFKNTLNN
ncbi:uncharacterized protein LOC143853958 [Tasmannia lanceolata]|uniref:uncharacterized protein LOC143853958 n=1 Tax=Tasmannia lanceolata TaxID=3420 RepID=UPI00406461D3